MKTINAFFILIFLSLSLTGLAQNTDTEDPVSYDSKSREWKSYDENRLQEFKADSDFDYAEIPQGSNFFEKLSRWIWEKITSFFEGMESLLGVQTATVLEYIMYAIGIGGIVYLIIKLTGSGFTSGTYNNLKDKSAYSVSDENIHEIDFTKSIDEAVENGEFRKAIRLIYLFALKELSDKQLITWEMGKTNHDYLYEIKSKPLRRSFSDLGYFFEFTWYGNFEANKKIYTQTKTIFDQFQSTLEKE